MQYNFDKRHNRRATDCIKWRLYPEDTIPMWVADMDFVAPEPVVTALHDLVEGRIFGYPASASRQPDDAMELRLLLVERMERLYGWGIETEDILFTPGVATGFNLACHMASARGSSVLAQPPVYPPFLRAPSNAGLQRRDAELLLGQDGCYRVDLNRFEEAITEDTSLFILCSPHNPVGRVFQREELEQMAEICLRKNVLICSDEIHCDLIFPGYHHIPIASLSPEVAANTITLMAPSKTFNLPGLQFSFAVIQNPKLRIQFRKAHQGLVPWTTALAIAGAEAAYRDGQEWLDQVMAYLQQNLDYLVDFIRSEMPEISLYRPEGTYLAWLDCRRSGIDGSPYQHFLEKARVGLMDGKEFGAGGEGFVRLNFACPRGLLEEALGRMKASL
jgi:cysteine-S-conjugate beta-lyase